MTFGQRLRALRRARMLTQAEFAALIGAHATEVSHWETGRNLPRPGRQRQIVRALGLSPQEFGATGPRATTTRTTTQRRGDEQ